MKTTELTDEQNELYMELKKIAQEGSYDLSPEVTLNENGNIIISTFACCCNDENEKTLRKMVLAIFNGYGHSFNTIDDLVKTAGIYLPNWMTATLDEYDMSISYIITDQWSMMGIDNYYSQFQNVKFSIQYDVMADGIAHAIMLKLMLLNGDISLPTA